jgi:hypothetical protein
MTSTSYTRFYMNCLQPRFPPILLSQQKNFDILLSQQKNFSSNVSVQGSVVEYLPTRCTHVGFTGGTPQTCLSAKPFKFRVICSCVQSTLILDAHRAPLRCIRHICSFCRTLQQARSRPPFTFFLVVNTMCKSLLAKETGGTGTWHPILFPNIIWPCITIFHV